MDRIQWSNFSEVNWNNLTPLLMPLPRTHSFNPGNRNEWWDEQWRLSAGLMATAISPPVSSLTLSLNSSSWIVNESTCCKKPEPASNWHWCGVVNYSSGTSVSNSVIQSSSLTTKAHPIISSPFPPPLFSDEWYLNTAGTYLLRAYLSTPPNSIQPFIIIYLQCLALLHFEFEQWKPIRIITRYGRHYK